MTIRIDAEPLAVWDANDRDGLFWKHAPETCDWAIKHLGQDAASITSRIDFYLIDGPFAVLHQLARDEDGFLAFDPVTRDLYFAEPVTEMLDELPPPHLLGR